MMEHLVAASLRFRGLVILGFAGLSVAGATTYHRLAVDAFPDISPVLVPVYAEAHGMAAEDVERLITVPMENAMRGLPGVTEIKSTSAFGLAVVYVYFEDRTDIYFARQLVSERLNTARTQLPDLHDPPLLGPISTGLGQIFMYYLAADDSADTGGLPRDTFLRDLNDWVVKPQLQSVEGVTDILSMGGHVLQYEIRIDPHLLHRYGMSLRDLIEAVRSNNRNAGGQFLVLGAEESMVRGIGLLESVEQIRDIPVRVVDGVPLTIGAVADVVPGAEIRRGVVTRNGEGEVVLGLVLKLYGENSSAVMKRLHSRVEAVRASLPAGVELVPCYDQSELVGQATQTVKKALVFGGALVMLALLLFMGDVASAVIVLLALPVSALLAVLLMSRFGVSANLMTLGGLAIAIGMLGDGAVVMVENIYRHLGEPENHARQKRAIVLEAAQEVARPIFFAVSIVILVFVPLHALQGVEGKMFRPMALSTTFALGGSLAVALLLAPALSFEWLRRKAHPERPVMRWVQGAYRALLTRALQRRRLLPGLALAGALASLALVPRIGTEFVPTLEEGSLLIGLTLAPSISLDHATEIVQLLEGKVRSFPQVKEVITRIGRPEAGSHPHPVNTAEMQVSLQADADKEVLVRELDALFSTWPGVLANFTQPIQNAFDELLSGIKAQVAIKVFGDDLKTLQETAERIRTAIEDVPGLVDLSVEQSHGQPQTQILVNRADAARHAVTVEHVLELIELAIGGEPVDVLYSGQRRHGIQVRYREPFRADAEAIRSLLVPTPDGALVSLEQVAEVREVVGPVQIQRENNRRRWLVQGNVRGRDLGGVVSDLRARIAERVSLPSGVTLEFGGQFENQQRAMRRFSVLVPLVIAAVFLLLWMALGAWRHAGIVLVSIPLALVGGMVGLWICGEFFSVPASVGFIALLGIAVQNGVVLVSQFIQLRHAGRTPDEAVVEGSLLRLRPALMTAFTTVLGLLPLLLSRGPGAEVQRPLAAVVVLGLTTSTLLTLFILPAVFASVEGAWERRRAG